MTRAQLERDFQERRRVERRQAINAGIAALHDRRASSFQDEGLKSELVRRGENARIADWLARFDTARGLKG